MISFSIWGKNKLSYNEAFCAKIRTGFDQAGFNEKHQIIGLFDIRGKIAFENERKVVYLKCLMDPKEKQQRLPIPTSPLSSSGNRQQAYVVTARLVLDYALNWEF